VSASVNLPLHHKVQKFSSGTGSPGWSRKKGRKTVVVVVVLTNTSYSCSVLPVEGFQEECVGYTALGIKSVPDVPTCCSEQNVVHQPSECRAQSTPQRLVGTDGLQKLNAGYVISQFM